MREVDERSRLSEEAPPPELDMTYWKTRVHRVLSQRYRVNPGTRTVRIPLDSRLLMLGEGLDPYYGRMWVKVLVTGELSASVKVLWTLPESARSYTFLSTSLAVDQVVELPLWTGPIPHGVEVELSFVNNGAAADARVTLDAMAKRRGSNFDTGMWLRSDAGSYQPERLGLWEPDEDPEGSASVVPAGACVRTLSHGGVHAAPMTVPDREDPRWCCTPDESATDWEDPRAGAEFHVTTCAPRDFHDPEVVATLKMLAPYAVPGPAPSPGTAGPVFTFEYAGITSFTPVGSLSPERDARGFVFAGYPVLKAPTPVRYPSTPLEADMPTLAESVGRCDGFDELWRDVTFGLEDKKLPRSILSLLLPEQRGAGQSDRWMRMRDIIDADGPMDTDWTWKATAPWLSSDVDMWQTWYMISLINLVHSTMHLIPERIQSNYGLRGRFRLRESKRFREHKINSSQAIWRLDGIHPPFLRIFGGSRKIVAQIMRAQNLDFSLNSLMWPTPIFGRANFTPALFVGKMNSGSPKAKTSPLPAPIPSAFVMSEWFWVPFANAATQLYSLARILTMFAIAEKRHAWREDNGGPGRVNPSASDPTRKAPASAVDELFDAAQLVYRHYLACLAIPAKTLIHEIFHTFRTGEGWTGLLAFSRPASVGLGLILDSVRHGLRTNHCLSGCGQEKLATEWFANVGAKTAFLPIVSMASNLTVPGTTTNLNGITAPVRFWDFTPGAVGGGPIGPLQPWPFTNSKCSNFGGGTSISTSFIRWPIRPGRRVSWTWSISQIAASPTSLQRFQRYCWNPGLNGGAPFVRRKNTSVKG